MVGSVYATDYSNASATGVFEPFTVCAVPEKYCCSSLYFWETYWHFYFFNIISEMLEPHFV